MWESIAVIYLLLTVLAFFLSYAFDLFSDKRSKFQRLRQIVGYALSGWLIVIITIIMLILYGVVLVLNYIFRLDVI